MSNRKPAEVFHPGEFIRDELEERGWTQSDLAKIMGRPLASLNLIINGLKSITPETAVELSGAFGTSAELWMNLETAYRLSKVSVQGENSIRERAKLFISAPVKDMQKRGWIKPTREPNSLRACLEGFFSLPESNRLRVATKSSNKNSDLSQEQFAWCVRCLQLAKSVPAKQFTERSIDEGISKLRALADFPENVRLAPRVLGEIGIRFVLVEDLPKSKIDGAALWLGEGWDRPVIALSLRFDRIDSFWHTLFHECSHIKHGDSILDIDMVGAERCLSREDLSEIEARANEEASNWLIPSERLDSFIRRIAPYFSTAKIIQFAHTLKIHPGIIAGQLQHRGQIDWAAHRKMLVKVREILMSGALVDGYGSGS